MGLPRVDVKDEREREAIICSDPQCIESGFTVLGKQVATGIGRIDVLGLTAEKALAVVELKVVEDDAMLMQAFDYYIWVSENRTSLDGLYQDAGPDPELGPQILLVAPSFSERTRRRATYLNEYITSVVLYAYQAVQIGKTKRVVLMEHPLAPMRKPPVPPRAADSFVDYIQEESAKKALVSFRNYCKKFLKMGAEESPTQSYLGYKLNQQLFGWVSVRRNRFDVGYRTPSGEWDSMRIEDVSKLDELKKAVAESFDYVRGS